MPMLTDSLGCCGPFAADTVGRPFSAELDTAVVGRLPHPAVELSSAAEDAVALTEHTPQWESGLEGDSRPSHPGHDSSLLALLGVVAVALMMCSRSMRRVLSALVGELWSVRPRANIFDEPVGFKSPSVIVLLAQYVVCTGLLLYCALDFFGVTVMPYTFVQVICVMGVSAGYYLFQLLAYSVVGYTFASSGARLQWLRGFNASVGLAGLALSVPVLVVLFYPSLASAALSLAAALYLVARTVFVIKGVRIFYDKIQSIVFFILYLCTLEIIPPIFVYFSASVLVNHYS